MRATKFGEVGGGCLREHGIVDKGVQGGVEEGVDFEVESDSDNRLKTMKLLMIEKEAGGSWGTSPYIDKS
jgi:hypothetical protein